MSKLPRIPDLGAALGMPPLQERERTPEEIEQDARAFGQLLDQVGWREPTETA